MRERLLACFRNAPRRALRSDHDLDRAALSPDAATGLRPAAVLVPIVLHPEPTVLLTRRDDRLPEHPGQISFPGGSVEPGDRDPVDTALREAAEEIALAPEAVEIVGHLDPYVTVTGYCVDPVVGLVRPPLSLVPDPREVAAILEVPLDFVLDPRNRQVASGVRHGVRRQFYAIPYREHYIWGATAHMLVNLAEVLGAAGEKEMAR